jgi:hypothetical protein
MMKQKFAFEFDEKSGKLTISELAESDPGTFLPLHFEEYDLEELKAVLDKGQDAVMETVRRKNFFPPGFLTSRLYTSLVDFINQDGWEKLMMEYDDVEALDCLVDSEGVETDPDEEDDEDDDDVGLDGLLTSDDEDLSEDDIKEIDSDDDTPRFKVDNDSEEEN